MQQLGYNTSTMNDTEAEDNCVIKQATEAEIANYKDKANQSACKK